MKKASRILVLILVVAMVLGVVAGCGMFDKNTLKYRSTTAFTVGNQEVNVGKLIDTFNNYYSQYGSYISNGYVTADDIFQMAVTSLYSQYMKIDEYTQSGAKTYTHKDRGVVFANQQFLDNGEDGIDELEYAIRYIKYVLFTTFDTMVEGYVGADFDLKDKEDETEDTSREFAEFDDLNGAKTYSKYTYNQNFVNEDMDEYIDKFYKGIISTDKVSVDDYVYADSAKSSEQVANRLKKLNDRIKDENKLDFETYKAYQERALAQYKKNVVSSYQYDIDALIKRQVEDFISSTIVTKWNYTKYSAIDGTDDGKKETFDKLREDLEKNTLSQKTDFNINDSYVKFIEGLSTDSYIYNVPKDEAGNQLYNYVFVKNILIPFSTEQTTILSAIEKQLGTTDDTRGLYKAIQMQFASQIVADDFNSEKDEDGKYATIENIFGIKDDKLIINTTDTEKTHAAYDAFGKFFASEDGRVDVSDIKDLMLRFNTDTAQHSAAYDYVVRVGAVPENYKAKWVPEFVDAANDAVLNALGWNTQIGADKRFATREDAVNAITAADLKTAKPGTFGVAISSYGVHIVYFESVVTEQTFDFDVNWLNTATPEYKLFKALYSTKSTEILEEATKELQKVYYNGKIVPTSELNKFAKDNGFSFDFDESIKLDDEEEN